MAGRAGGNIRAGHLQLCDGTKWKYICHNGWDLRDAKVACRQLGFPEGGKLIVQHTHIIVTVYRSWLLSFRLDMGTRNRMV